MTNKENTHGRIMGLSVIIGAGLVLMLATPGSMVAFSQPSAEPAPVMIHFCPTVTLTVYSADGTRSKTFSDVQLVWDPVDMRCEFPRMDDIEASENWVFDTTNERCLWALFEYNGEECVRNRVPLAQIDNSSFLDNFQP
jgi:hypothetical protein